MRRAQAELAWLPVATRDTMTYVWNEDGSLRRAYQDLADLSPVAQKMWQLRNMICNWLGPAYNERRTAFHISFDQVL